MAVIAAPGEQYTIRRKVFKILGASFHVYDAEGHVIGFCSQKALKLREDIRIFTDESMRTEKLRMTTRAIIDFGASYDVVLPDGSSVGSLRRKGLTSIFRDSWRVFGPDNTEVASLIEDSAFKAIIRRSHDVFSLIPQTFHITAADGTRIATFRQHFNPLIYRLGIAIDRSKLNGAGISEPLVLAAAALIAAIEGRQG
ncbi:MAG TPA: hypothetical protein VD971_02265 [Phycisphaerales bacterium]|nr:hypothetical protein [Phycisphaerales bacterium]